VTPRGSYPKLYRAIKDMAIKEALGASMARKIARKAGLRAGQSTDGVSNSPVTLVDVTLGENFVPLEWQWFLDLSTYTSVRFDARGELALYAFYSKDLTIALSPTDWLPVEGYFPDFDFVNFLSASEGAGHTGEALRWMNLPEELKVPLRFCLSYSASEVPTEAQTLSSPVGAWIQAE
jgi:hypothetical protein